jgi:ubiquinone/menaquinone biosynthesis C-methylase UbiE
MGILTDFSEALARRMTLTGADVLDVGSGDGAFSRELARRGAHVTGLECSEAQLALCREAAPVADERYLSGVGEALPFPDSTFDAVVFRASLHHVPPARMADALREALRVVRDGGELFVFEPLAEGAWFEMMRVVDDETVVRRLAQEAVARAVDEGWLRRLDTQTLMAESVFPDLDAVRRRTTAIEAGRKALFDARRGEIERHFLGAEPAPGGGRLFRQDFRLDVLGGA